MMEESKVKVENKMKKNETKKSRNIKLSESIHFRQTVTGTIGTIVLLLGSIIVLYPLAWMLATALKSDAEVMINPYVIW